MSSTDNNSNANNNTFSYKVKQSDTLSGLAKRYNTNIATLKSLNAQQIKDIDLIYDGNALVIPIVLDVSSDEREQRKVLSVKNLIAAPCKKQIYVDALYVPEHPDSKKQKLILLSKEAKECIEADAAVCAAAVDGSKEEMLKKLAKLGVLDPFSSLGHEAFLRKSNKPKLADDYKEALLVRNELATNYANNEMSIPNDDPNIGLVGVSKRLNQVNLDFDEYIAYLKKHKSSMLRAMAVTHKTQDELLKSQYSVYVRKVRRLQKALLGELDDKIRYFIKAAQKIASKIEIDEEGHYYQYSTKKDYYSSNDQLTIYAALEKLIQERPKPLSSSLSTNDVTSNHDIMDLDEAYKIYCYWCNTADASLTTLSPRVDRGSCYKATLNDLYFDNDAAISHYRQFFAAIFNLNQAGVLVKEQCLTEAELFAGHAEVNEFQKNLFENNPSILDIYSKLNNNVIDIAHLGYFSAYTLELTIVYLIGERIADFIDLIGKNEHYRTYVNQIFVFAEKAKVRCDELKEIAEQKKDSPVWNYRKGAGFDTQENTLIWEESRWAPKDLSGHIHVSSGKNDRKIVECAFSSAPNVALYILSDNAALSSDWAEHQGKRVISEQLLKCFLIK